jgi:phosphoribosylformimino-5-aminoimidazole carboxamide ribotide isomerase
MRIIPAIDIIDGKCVRLKQGDYAQKIIYNENPLDVAKSFEDAGLTYLHLIDLDGAKAGKVVSWDVVERITRGTKLEVDFGGGIKTSEEIARLLDLGVRQVNIGSVAIKEPERFAEWLITFGAEKIILSADVKNGTISIHGWQEDAQITVMAFLKDYVRKGIVHVACTDIGTDGMLTGPNFELYKNILLSYPTLHLIASGGVSSIDDLHELKRIGADGAIVGKAIYEGKITLQELTEV